MISDQKNPVSEKELRALYALTAALSKSVASEQIVKIVSKYIQSYIKSESSAAWIANHHHQPSLLYSVNLKSTELAGLSKKLSLGEKLPSLSLQKKGAYLIAHIHTGTAFSAFMVFSSSTLTPKDKQNLSLVLRHAQQALLRAEKYEANTKLRKETQRSLIRINGLQRTTNLLSQATTKAQVANIIVNEGFTILGAENGEISLFQPEKNTFSILAYKGYCKEYLKKWPRLTSKTPLLATEVVKTKKPLYIDDAKQIPKKFQVAKDFFQINKTVSAAILPLIIKKQAIGMMQFTFKKLQQFLLEDKKFMKTLADQCSQAFDRINAQEDLKKSKEELETILQRVANGIIVRNTDGTIIYANPLAAKLHKLTSSDQLQNLSPKAYYNIFSCLTDEFKNSQCLEDFPFMKILAAKPYAKETFCVTFSGNAKQYWLSFKSVGIYNTQRKLELIVDVVTDITKQKIKERQKDEFIAIASHELKTPVTVMKTFAQLMQTRFIKKDAEALHLMQKVNTQIDKLSVLIDDMLDISKIEEGKLQFQEEMFSFDEFVTDAVEDIKQINVARTIVIIGSTKASVYADRGRIAQVLTNFLSNAIKYSPNKKEISVLLSRHPQNNHIIVGVKDHGIGISQDAKPHIFERFFRESNPQKKTFPGLGLGLYICKEIIKNQGGEIWFESQKNKGTTFYFSLPIQKRT